MFSEEVAVQPTTYDFNFLTTPNFNEIYFDVYEIEINNHTYIAEKVSEYKGMPVVNIPLTINNQSKTAAFVLRKGSQEILFNSKNASTSHQIISEEVNNAILDIEIDTIITDKETIAQELKNAKQSAEKYAEAIKQQKIFEAAKEIDQKQELLKEEINLLKTDLFNEFYELTETVRSELHESSDNLQLNIKEFILNSLDSLSTDLETKLELHQENAIEHFTNQIEVLAKNILKNTLLNEIDKKHNNVVQDFNEKFKTVSEYIDKCLTEDHTKIVDIVNTKFEDYNAALITLEKVNVEINESVKNLSTVFSNNINSVTENFAEKLNESNNAIDSLISTRIELATTNIHDFYDNKIQLIEANVTDITTAQKQEFINLINESKQSLLSQIAEIKIVPNQILIEQRGNKPIDLNDVKKDLEKEITSKFTNEIVNLKRYIELSSGGGSVAQQFANGGTMRGNLVVVGTLSASQYLGIPSSGPGGGGPYLPLSGGTLTGGLTANNNVLILGALSASQYLGISIPSGNYLPLSGGTLTGSLTANNNVLILGTLSASQYLGLSIPSGNYLPLSGGALSGDLTANNVTVLGALSAAQYLGLSIPSGNYLPLSGGIVTGDTSFQSLLSSNRTITNTLTCGGTSTWSIGLSTITHILGPSDQDLKINAGKSLSAVPALTTAGQNLRLAGGSAVKGANLASAYGGSTYILAGDSAAEFGTYSGGFTSIKGGKNNGGSYSGEIIVWGGYGSGGINGNTGGYGVSVFGSGSIFVGTDNQSSAGGAGVILKTGYGGGAGSSGQPGGNMSIFTGKGNGEDYSSMTTGGNGGIITLSSGDGGRASAGTAGNAGSISITTGNGGAGSTINGNGGSITLATGIAGAGIGTPGTVGSINFNPGSTNVLTVSATAIRATQPLNLENGTTSNSMYVYNTYTSSTTYERAYLNWVSNTLQIGTDKGSGGGVARSINLQTDGTTRMSIAATSGDVNVVGNFSAATKSFLIPHPTKIDKQLQYGCLEGPENGVYVRGKTNESIIYLPEYWKALVDEESVTVTLTSINKYQQLYIESQDSMMVKIGNVTGFYNYVIFGERKDVNKLQTEI